jgi:serine phosphatase RsbU (regulator of sigma subunit)/anti-sigma regulatory factor (Ser/Thr protein kinase)
MSEARGKSSACAQFRYSLPCDIAEVPNARQAVRRFLAEQGLHEEELAACELALAEACNNAIQNVRNGGNSHPVEITVLCSNSKVEMCVNDHTPGFEWPDQIDLPDAQCERGRGLFFIQSFMDTASYFRGKDENSLVMRKMRYHQEHRQSAVAASLNEVQQRLEETQHALTDMARELCFRTESLSAIFRCTADLDRSNDLPDFARCLLNDLLHIASADWFVLRVLEWRDELHESHKSHLHESHLHGTQPPPKLGTRVTRPSSRLVQFAASPGLDALEPLSINDAGQDAPSVELQAALARHDVAFGPNRPLAINDPLARKNPYAVGIVRPFMARDSLIGTVTVGKSTSDKPFTAAQTKVIHTFADFLGIQIVNARLREEQLSNRLLSHELQIARNIQRSLLPKALPQLRHFGVAGYCESAHQVGGDFYDVLQLSDNSLLLVVADVMGKGVPAALFAAIFHSLVRALPEWTQCPAELLARLNWHMYEDLSAVDMFVTAQIVLINSRKNQMTVASAGHCPVLLAQAGNPPVKSIAPEGMPLGILPTTRFVEETHELRAPFRILLHTDGLVERRDGGDRLMAQARLERWLKDSLLRERTAEQLRDELAAELRAVGGTNGGTSYTSPTNPQPLEDDQTFLIVAEQQLDDAGNG